MDFGTIVVIVLTVYSYYYMKKVLDSGAPDQPLTPAEKKHVIPLILINTVFSWVIFSVGWKEKLPQKAQQVTGYLKNILKALVVLAILSLALAFVFIAIGASR